MEFFGLGWVLRHFGYLGSLAWLLVMAACGAILGLRYAKQNNSLRSKDPQVSTNIIKFAIFLWTTWLFTFGIQYWMFNGPGWGLWFAVVAAVGSVFLSQLLTCSNVSLADEGGEEKAWTLIISSIIVGAVVGFNWGNDAPLVTLTKEERTSYVYHLVTKEKDNYQNVFYRLERLKVKHHPYFYAIAKAKLQKRDEAAKYFQTYAESLPTEKKLVWLAFYNFFRNDFWSAEKLFRAAGQDHYALWSRFRNNQLSSSDLKQFIGSHSLGNDELSFFAKLQDVVNTTENIQTRLGGSYENFVYREEFAKLQRMIEDLSNQVKKNAANGKEQTKPVSSDASYAAEVERVSKLRGELNADIDGKVIELAVRQAPPLPVPEMDKFADTSQYGINTWAVISAFAFFLLCLFTISFTWREKSEEIKKFFGTLAGSIGLSSRISKLGWHSKFARATAARLAKMEPEDEKGLFSEEIKRIHAAVFPADILIGFRYHFKARRALLTKSIVLDEREDLLFIHGVIRKLSGKLIPHGDEQALSIITALRERANAGLQNYRKGQLKFLLARDELLAVQKELVTLGDILDAFGEKPDLTNYHLLGLEPKRGVSDTEVKQAYRSVMSAVHPDHNPNNKFVENLAKLVIGAYGTLGNPNRRAAYETAIRL